MNEETTLLNTDHFVKMAHGNVGWLRELALEFFADTRRLIPDWQALVAAGDLVGLRAELHRCKGGATLFGVERLVAMILDYEKTQTLETLGFDAQAFAHELDAAAEAVATIIDPAE